MAGGAWSNDQPRNFLFPPGGSLTLPHVILGPDVPAVLTAGILADFTWEFVFLWYYDATQFWFQGIAMNSFFGLSEVVTGIYTTASGVQLQTFVDGPGGAPNSIHYGTDRYDTVRLALDYRTADINVTSTATWSIDGFDQGRGRKASTASTSATVATATGAAVTVLTIFGFPFLDSRAYLIVIRGQVTSTLAQRSTHQIRTVNAAGQVLLFGDKSISDATAVGEDMIMQAYAYNNSGSTITHDVLWLLSAGTGANPVKVVSTFAVPVYIEIWDIGTATDYTNVGKALT
jgi:hypothetical protein